MAKDRRSKADKLRDGILGDIHQRIEQIELVNEAKRREIAADEAMIKVLRQQIEDIKNICKGQDGSKAKA